MPPIHLVMGPGPSNVVPEMLAAQARPTIGHLYPDFTQLMELIKAQLGSLSGRKTVSPSPVTAGLARHGDGAGDAVEPGDTARITAARWSGT